MPDRKLICAGLDILYFPHIAEMLEKAIDDTATLDDIKRMIESKDVQLWAFHDGEIHAVMTTELVCYKRYKAVRVLALSGDNMASWLDLLIDTLERWGKSYGAEAIEFAGRKGWERVLTSKGFGNTKIFMQKKF